MLPASFHQTFVPERRYISALLRYAAQASEGTISEIAAQTGIPMGRSSGKASATLDYARGMGLVELGTPQEPTAKRPTLTAFGNAVCANDRFLGEPMTQWLAHMNLCSPRTGAVAWYEAFAVGRQILGVRFTRDQLEAHLFRALGRPPKGRTRTGPLVTTYLEDEALGKAGVLSIGGDTIARAKAPILGMYAMPYSAHILSLMEAFFPGQNQVTFSDFNVRTSWFDICLWNQPDIELAFSIVERLGFVSVDRQMHPWIVERRAKASDVWPLIYSEIA